MLQQLALQGRVAVGHTRQETARQPPPSWTAALKGSGRTKL